MFFTLHPIDCVEKSSSDQPTTPSPVLEPHQALLSALERPTSAGTAQRHPAIFRTGTVSQCIGLKRVWRSAPHRCEGVGRLPHCCQTVCRRVFVLVLTKKAENISFPFLLVLLKASQLSFCYLQSSLKEAGRGRMCFIEKTGGRSNFIFSQDLRELWSWTHRWTLWFPLRSWASHWHSCRSVGKSSFGSSSVRECGRHGLVSHPERHFLCSQLPLSNMKQNSPFPPAVPALSVGFHAKVFSGECYRSLGRLM